MEFPTDQLNKKALQKGKLNPECNAFLFVSYAYIEADVLIEGKPNKVIMDIRKSPQKNLFWVHSVYEIKENQTLLESSGQSPKLAFNEMSDLQKDDITRRGESQENNALKQKTVSRLLQKLFPSLKKNVRVLWRSMLSKS